jgi:hypothetical protein
MQQLLLNAPGGGQARVAGELAAAFEEHEGRETANAEANGQLGTGIAIDLHDLEAPGATGLELLQD